VILITHDLGVVAETAQRVIVMYAGRKVEEAEVGELFAHPLHPYTRRPAGLDPAARPAARREPDAGRLQEIPGIVPPLFALPEGCAFAPRCPRRDDKCRASGRSTTRKRGHWAACWHPHG
jgi:peptide/nickel transport system ATP-binding protein